MMDGPPSEVLEQKIIFMCADPTLAKYQSLNG